MSARPGPDLVGGVSSRAGRCRRRDRRRDPLGGQLDHEPGQEDLDQGADRQGVEHSAHTDHAAEQPAEGEDGQLETGAHQPNAAPGPPYQAGHQPVARTGAELGADVHPARQPVQDDPPGQKPDPGRHRLRSAEQREAEVDLPEASGEAIAKEFENLARKARQTRANLAKLDPPDNAREEFDALLSALGDGSDDLGAVAAASREDDPAKAAEAAQDLVKSGTRIQEAETDLKKEVDG